MLKYLFLLSFVCSYAQEHNVLYATTSKNVNIFFHSPITTAIVGNENFSFGFNREGRSNYGMLKAFPGSESNLLITTENGNVFSFIVRYKKDVTLFNHWINDSLAIGNIKSPKHQQTIGHEVPDISKTVTINDFEEQLPDGKTVQERKDNSHSNFEKISKGEIEKDRYFLRFYDSSSRVFMHLKNIYYEGDELYFTLNIDNRSNLDYDVEDLSFFITARKASRKTSTQRINYEPVYVHEKPARIKAFSQHETVYVFKKFSINSQKVFLATLSEYKGERNLTLEIPNSNINNPN